jgi:hypothetical protein
MISVVAGVDAGVVAEDLSGRAFTFAVDAAASTGACCATSAAVIVVFCEVDTSAAAVGGCGAWARGHACTVCTTLATFAAGVAGFAVVDVVAWIDTRTTAVDLRCDTCTLALATDLSASAFVEASAAVIGVGLKVDARA